MDRTGGRPGVSDHIAANRAAWAGFAKDYVEPARRHWGGEPPHWGIWQIPEAELGVVGDVDGLDVIELGCGTAYWSAWLARAGARVTGIDLSAEQLATARELQAEHGLQFPLIHGNAEDVPLPDASFDLALSEYGASLWCDPHRWIPEAARLLRPGGRLVFLTNSPLLMLCTPPSGDPAGTELVRDQFGMHRFEWPDEAGVEFHLPHGELIDVLAGAGLRVQALRELRAPEGASTRYDFVSLQWSRRWPCEEIWVARRA